MALIKEKELDNGVSGDYWKIIKADIDFLENRAEIWVGLLKDKAFNDEKYGKKDVPNSSLLISVERFIFEGDNFPFTKEAIEGVNIKAVAYKALKENEEFFSDAQDDIASAQATIK